MVCPYIRLKNEGDIEYEYSSSCAKPYFVALWGTKHLYKQIGKYLWIAAILCKEYPIWKKPKVLTIKMICDGLGITLAQFFDTDEFNHLE